MKETSNNPIQLSVEKRIYLVHGKKVMLDRDLAVLYGVETKQLNRQVRRHIERFPEDFMFPLSRDEVNSLRRQSGTLEKSGRGMHSKYTMFAFTEHGILMLSSVLNSSRAIEVNIQIMRTFTKLREMLATHKNLKEKIEKMEKKYDQQFKVVFDALRELLTPDEKPAKKIGFHAARK